MKKIKLNSGLIASSKYSLKKELNTMPEHNIKYNAGEVINADETLLKTLTEIKVSFEMVEEPKQVKEK